MRRAGILVVECAAVAGPMRREFVVVVVIAIVIVVVVAGNEAVPVATPVPDSVFVGAEAAVGVAGHLVPVRALALADGLQHADARYIRQRSSPGTGAAASASSAPTRATANQR